MELESATTFLRNKTILITGGTGFLAKILIEKILRVQPNVNKLYLLLRAKDKQSSYDRLHNEIINKDLFGVLKEKQGENFSRLISEKVRPIDGDTSLPNLGIEDKYFNELCQQIHVIIHSAATTRFNERYDLALSINTMGPANVIELAKRCSNLQIVIHVSTAYVCGEKKGLILEEVCEMGKSLNGRPGLNIEAEKKLVDEILINLTSKHAPINKIKDTFRRLGQQRARKYGWPNTYVFTKAMGEMLMVDNAKDVPLAIIRPTMICTTFKDPFPGWIENDGVAATSVFLGKRLIHFIHADKSSIVDVIPADMVVNSILMAIVANANMPKLTIYQVGSSLRNPLTFGKLFNSNYNYFLNNPWVDTHGMPVKPLDHRCRTFPSKFIFFSALLFQLPKLLVLKFVDILTFRSLKINPDEFEMQLKLTVKIAELFGPYLLFNGIFDDTNTEKLRTVMRQNARDEDECFNFDPTSINWNDYLYKVHIPAAVKYLF